MTLDYDALREVWRKTGDSERFAKADVQATPDTCYAVTFTPHELHALNELLAEGLTEPDHHEGNYAANLAGGRVGDQPMQDPYGRYTRPEEERYLPQKGWSHTIVVKGAAAVPGVQALLFLYKAVSDVEVSPAGIDGTHWQLTWQGDRDVDLDFLRPHILPPLVR